jgi:F-type H+-transporting ATPase subunit b
METLKQVGELLLNAIPTVLLLLFLYVSYRLLVHRPLERVLAERHSRTEGAVERARADIAAAEAKTAEYEQRLREAKAAIFRTQEARRQQAAQRRAAAVAEARQRAEQQVRSTRESLQQEMRAAQAALEVEGARLADEIIRTVLRPALAPVGGAK